MYSCSFIINSSYSKNQICFASYVNSAAKDKCIVIETKKTPRFTKEEVAFYLKCIKKLGFKFKVTDNHKKFTKTKVKGFFIYGFEKQGAGIIGRKYETIFCMLLRCLWEDSENTFISGYPGGKFSYDDFYVTGRLFLRLVKLFPRTNKLKLMHTAISTYSTFGFRYNSNHFFVSQGFFSKRSITKITKDNIQASVIDTFNDWDDDLKTVYRLIADTYKVKSKSYDDYTVINDEDLYVFHKLMNDLKYNTKLSMRKNLESVKKSIKRRRECLIQEYEQAK